MSPEIYALMGMTVTILIAIFVSNRALRTELKNDNQELRAEFKNDVQEFRAEFKNNIQELKTDLDDLRTAQHALNERMASLEGLVTGLKEVIIARFAA